MSNLKGITITGTVRSIGSNQNNKPFVQLEIPSGMGTVELFKVSVKNNGQKLHDDLTLRVAPNVFDGKFYGFREL